MDLSTKSGPTKELLCAPGRISLQPHDNLAQVEDSDHDRMTTVEVPVLDLLNFNSRLRVYMVRLSLSTSTGLPLTRLSFEHDSRLWIYLIRKMDWLAHGVLLWWMHLLLISSGSTRIFVLLIRFSKYCLGTLRCITIVHVEHRVLTVDFSS